MFTLIWVKLRPQLPRSVLRGYFPNMGKARKTYLSLSGVACFAIFLMSTALVQHLSDVNVRHVQRDNLVQPKPGSKSIISIRNGTKSRERTVAHEQKRTGRTVRTEGYTCETNISAAFDSKGNSCIDIDKAASLQGIYAVRTKDASYVFCSIPKNGCTYHLALMHRLTGHEYGSGAIVHNNRNKGRLEVEGNVLREMMIDPRMEKYLVVRNPMERILSAYLDKIERLVPEQERTADTFEAWARKTLTFGMEKKMSKQLSNHWKPQIGFCGFGMRDMMKRFRVFRVEDPVKYVDYLEKLLPSWVMDDGWDDRSNCSFRQFVLGPRKRTVNSSEKFFQYVRTTEFFDFLADIYRIDIEALEYEQEVAAMRQELLKTLDDV